eukprot:15313719-Alexandrium_andersonii.AAC.1
MSGVLGMQRRTCKDPARAWRELRLIWSDFVSAVWGRIERNSAVFAFFAVPPLLAGWVALSVGDKR